MRRAALAAMLTTALVLAVPPAHACGDKLLGIARGTRLKQTYKAERPARMLMYVGDRSPGDSSRLRSELVQMSILYMSLRQAGHTVEVAQNAGELDEALRARKYEFVLAAPRDMEAVDRRLATAAPRTSKASLLPVLFKPRKEELAAAEKQYPLVFKVPASSTGHLAGIERLMKGRAASGI
jgi:hypothetical protein